jgi:hypothetical protein
VKEGSEEVAVMYYNGQLDKNIFVCEFRFLHARADLLVTC